MAVVFVASLVVLDVALRKFFLAASPPPNQQIATFGPEASPSATPITIPNAEKYLIAEAALLGITNNASFYFKDFKTGEQSSLDPTRSWIPASTIKAYVALEAFRQARLGLINFNGSANIQAKNVVPTELETDEFPRLREGVSATVRQLVEGMIVQSDNTAYNTLLDILDRRNINKTLGDLGITETVVGQKLNLDDNQSRLDVNVPGYQPNTTSAKDLATFFDLLYNHQIPGAEDILNIFKRQKINTMIPALLPQNTPVAHKTGDWSPIFHDGGIVFKPDDPFILSIFTNSGRPEVLANLARVAYFRDAQSVGVKPVLKTTAEDDYPSVELALGSDSRVLAATASAGPADKFPTITASDLGITQKDLNIDTDDLVKVRPDFITPNSFFYGLKRFWEIIQNQTAFTPEQKTQAALSQSISRLSEANALFNQGHSDLAEKLMQESQIQLARAVSLSRDSKNRERFLVMSKQVSDLQFVSLASASDNVPKSAKERFVDSVYQLYKNQQKTVLPAVDSSIISNPTSQKPAIATVEKVENGKLKIKSGDGQTKEVLVTDLTPVREFQSQTIQPTNQFSIGQKIAIIGQTDSQERIIPQFILSKIPAEVPTQINGTVVAINPRDHNIKIQESSGLQTTVNITLKTDIRSTNTSVSPSGIRAGSQVSVFAVQPAVPTGPSGLSTPAFGATPPATLLPTKSVSKPTDEIKPTPTPPTSTTPKPPASNGLSQTAPTPTPPPAAVQATTITITKNSSGVDEKIDRTVKTNKTNPTNEIKKNKAGSTNQSGDSHKIKLTPTKEASGGGSVSKQ